MSNDLSNGTTGVYDQAYTESFDLLTSLNVTEHVAAQIAHAAALGALSLCQLKILEKEIEELRHELKMIKVIK